MNGAIAKRITEDKYSYPQSDLIVIATGNNEYTINLFFRVSLIRNKKLHITAGKKQVKGTQYKFLAKIEIQGDRKQTTKKQKPKPTENIFEN